MALASGFPDIAPAAATLAPIICLEGPSAVGKTSLAAALARSAAAAVVPERTGTPPPGGEPAEWFVAQHVTAWTDARTLATSAPLVVLDGDPFKGLWYHWIFAEDSGHSVNTAATAYAREVARSALGAPDLYIVLGASEAELRSRRAGDVSRSRRNFETHLRLIEPQRRYFAALAEHAPGRVLWLDTAHRDGLVPAVLAAVAGRWPDQLDAAGLLQQMTEWVARNVP